MTARVVSLHSREAAEPPCPATADARVALVARLAREAWRLAGVPVPTYDRGSMPIAVTALGDQGRT